MLLNPRLFGVISSDLGRIGKKDAIHIFYFTKLVRNDTKRVNYKVHRMTEMSLSEYGWVSCARGIPSARAANAVPGRRGACLLRLRIPGAHAGPRSLLQPRVDREQLQVRGGASGV